MKRPRAQTIAGGAERLGDLFRRCSPDLHRYIRRRLRGLADTADLTQEVFERFVRGDAGARARNPGAYLFGIASHVVADARMAEQHSAVIYDSAMADKVAEQLPSEGADRPENLDLENELLEALGQLPEAHRAALLLTKRDGLSCREAALKMGTTEGSVRVYVCEARAQLKRLLKPG